MFDAAHVEGKLLEGLNVAQGSSIRRGTMISKGNLVKHQRSVTASNATHRVREHVDLFPMLPRSPVLRNLLAYASGYRLIATGNAGHSVSYRMRRVKPRMNCILYWCAGALIRLASTLRMCSARSMSRDCCMSAAKVRSLISSPS